MAYKAGSKDVLRASYGMFYAHAGGVGGRTNGRQGLSQIGFNSTGSLSSTVTGQPAYYWDNGYPGNPLAPPFLNPSYGIGFISASAPGIGSDWRRPKHSPDARLRRSGEGRYASAVPGLFIQHSTCVFTGYDAQCGLQRQRGKVSPGADVSGQFTNQIPLQYLPLGSLLTQTLSATTITQAAALGFTVASPFPNFTGTVGQSLKPYPQYNGLSNPWLDVGNSNYNSLQVSFNRRMSRGLNFMVNYTFSKEMDNLATARLPGANYLEYGLGTIHHAHVLSTTFVYKLPFGAGHDLNSGNPMVRTLVSNWQMSGIFTGSTERR